MPETFYTLQIHFGGSKEPEKIEMKDLTPGALGYIEWERQLRSNLFTTGFSIQTSPTTREFISPLHIHTAYLIRQDSKFNP